MSREALQESLSAVMDDEADELELRRVLAEAGGDAELRATWARYQVARAVMHRELLEPRLDMAAAVSAAIAEETPPVVARRGTRRLLGRMAVAASVTVAVLVGVRFYNQDELAGGQMAQQTLPPGLTLPQVQGPAVLAGYTEASAPQSQNALQPSSGWHEQRLPTYLRQHAQHAQQAAATGADSVLPYARAASLENR